jgi:hypothetical protein
LSSALLNLISAITIRLFLPLRDMPRYLRVVRRSGTLLGGAGTFVGMLVIIQVLFGPRLYRESIYVLVVFNVIPALLASLAIWRASAQIAAWYVRTADAHTALALRVGE